MNKNLLLCFIYMYFCICLVGCRKKEGVNGVPYRPEGFPEILVPLEGANQIRHLSPETGNVKGAYSISFWVDEEYPAKNTIEQIQNHLKSYNCVRVEGSVLNDLSTLRVIAREGSGKEVINIADDIRQELQKIQIPTETQWQRPHPQADYADVIHSGWTEEWITENDDLFTIVLDYYFPDKGYKDYRIWVHLNMFTPSPWIHVQRYKENHPDQFKDPNEIEKSPGD